MHVKYIFFSNFNANKLFTNFPQFIAKAVVGIVTKLVILTGCFYTWFRWNASEGCYWLSNL